MAASSLVNCDMCDLQTQLQPLEALLHPPPLVAHLLPLLHLAPHLLRQLLPTLLLPLLQLQVKSLLAHTHGC